ncbi:MAG: hypothetical protein M1313_00030 [Nitrospirae bacterium]|nr:hypothetical protein [Nitrospirota bacterium]
MNILAFLVHTVFEFFDDRYRTLRFRWLPGRLLPAVCESPRMGPLRRLGACHCRQVRQSPGRYQLSVLPDP